MSSSLGIPPTTSKSDVVSLGSHSLCLYTAGPASPPGSRSPTVVIIQGLACSRLGWAAVIRHLSSFIRVCSYDRAGYGFSDASPLPPTAENIAAELDLLLQNAGVGGPWILVAHSWGGILSREFLELLARRKKEGDVVGLVLVDANQERTLQVLDWQDGNLWAVAKDLDWYEATGLNREKKLTEEEWEAYVKDEASSRHQLQAQKEQAEYRASFDVLAAKAQRDRNPPLMGDNPVCVVMGRNRNDYERLYKAGVEKGNGTEEEREVYREFLRTWDEKDEGLQREHLKLSTNGKMVIAEESGHNVHLTQPDIIVDAVKWVLGEYPSRHK